MACDWPPILPEDSHGEGFEQVLPGQHFHIYLMAYGCFRFGHEFLHATPHILGPISGYQIGALGVPILGLVGFVWRRRSLTPAVAR